MHLRCTGLLTGNRRLRNCQCNSERQKLNVKLHRRFWCAKPLAHSPLPFFRRSQNIDGEVASPGKRHARPIIATGTWDGLLVEGMLPEIITTKRSPEQS